MYTSKGPRTYVIDLWAISHVNDNFSYNIKYTINFHRPSSRALSRQRPLWLVIVVAITGRGDWVSGPLLVGHGAPSVRSVDSGPVSRAQTCITVPVSGITTQPRVELCFQLIRLVFIELRVRTRTFSVGYLGPKEYDIFLFFENENNIYFFWALYLWLTGIFFWKDSLIHWETFIFSHIFDTKDPLGHNLEFCFRRLPRNPRQHCCRLRIRRMWSLHFLQTLCSQSGGGEQSLLNPSTKRMPQLMSKKWVFLSGVFKHLPLPITNV